MALADEVTLIAPGGMRCPIDRMKPDFEKKTGLTLKATIGAGGATHQQVVKGAPFDVPVVQPPYKDVIDSGNVVARPKRRSRRLLLWSSSEKAIGNRISPPPMP